jgi:hypothetical protein
MSKKHRRQNEAKQARMVKEGLNRAPRLSAKAGCRIRAPATLTV